jgi:hypothetical protein
MSLINVVLLSVVIPYVKAPFFEIQFLHSKIKSVKDFYFSSFMGVILKYNVIQNKLTEGSSKK